MNRLLITLLCLLVSHTAASDDAQRGAELLLPFKQQLKAALVTGLAEGPASAIRVCREEAPAIAASLSVDGVVMGRTSHRLRSPDNAPPAWAEPMLARYQSGEVKAPAMAVLGDGRLGYAEPITVQPLCLTCHGSQLSAEVSETLARLYPDDAATGFAEGDFRGLFWVEYPAAD
jgi:hypothetical protein